jgi:hypothetical protein
VYIGPIDEFAADGLLAFVGALRHVWVKGLR